MGNNTVHRTYHTDSQGIIFKSDILTKSIKSDWCGGSSRFIINFPFDSNIISMHTPIDRQKYYEKCFKAATDTKCSDILIDFQMVMNDYYVRENNGTGNMIPDPLYDPNKDCVINDAIKSFGLKYKTITMPGQNIGWSFMMIKMIDLKIEDKEIIAEPKLIKSDCFNMS